MIVEGRKSKACYEVQGALLLVGGAPFLEPPLSD
jgi:hypothetical protein